MSEILSLADLESSKIYVSETNQVFNFQHPMEYLQPFLDIMQDYNPIWTFEGIVGSRNKDVHNSSSELEIDPGQNIAYSRVIAKARLPKDFDLVMDTGNDFNHLWSEIGFIYALDGRNPELKAYRGKRVSICTNKCIWGADNITSLNLVRSSKDSIYTSLDKYANTAKTEIEKYRTTIEKLSNNVLRGEQIYNRIGKIFWECKKNPKLGTTCASDMLSFIQDSKTRYAIQNDETNDWLLYNACTESLKKSNLLDECSKALMLGTIFNDN